MERESARTALDREGRRLARFVAEPPAARLNQSVIVGNRPGGGGTIGTRAATEADGSTRRPANSNAGAYLRSRLS
jgi:tripartite-type tricarboxylate transporter receptor subunit TctC